MGKIHDIETIILQEWGADIYPKLSWFKQKKVSSAHVMVVGCVCTIVLQTISLLKMELYMVSVHAVEYVRKSVPTVSTDLSLKRKSRLPFVEMKLSLTRFPIRIFALCSTWLRYHPPTGRRTYPHM